MIRDQAETAAILVKFIWPHDTTESAGLALSEETGEVNRAILKRQHQRQGVGDRTTEDWDANLRLELGQTIITALAICHNEGFDPHEVIEEAIQGLQDRADLVPADSGDFHDALCVYCNRGIDLHGGEFWATVEQDPQGGWWPNPDCKNHGEGHVPDPRFQWGPRRGEQ